MTEPPSLNNPGSPCKRLLVPLDGSRLSEEALAPAVDLASRAGGCVILLHVIEHDAPDHIHGETHILDVDQAKAYLAGVARSVADTGVSVETHVHENPQRDLPASLVEHIGELTADLIVLAPHGSGGWRGFFFGRVAENIVKRAAAPIMIVQGLEHAPFEPRTIAMLHDPAGEWQAVLPPTLAIAALYQSTIHLIRVVPTADTLEPERAPAGMLLPSATRAVLDLEGAVALEELAGVAGGISRDGRPATFSVVRGDPAEASLAEAERAGADLLGLATHGKLGLSAILSGSVGSKVLRQFGKPLLLARSAD